MRPGTNGGMPVVSEQVGLLAGKTATYGGGASAFLLGLSANEVAAFVGAGVALLGYLTQVYFSRRRERREVEEHKARMASLGRRV